MENPVYQILGLLVVILLIPTSASAYGESQRATSAKPQTSTGYTSPYVTPSCGDQTVLSPPNFSSKYKYSPYRYRPNFDYKHKIGFKHSYGLRKAGPKKPKLPSSHHVHKAVPELDPLYGQSALFLLIGTVLVLHERRRRTNRKS